jgi:hypothetical protein
MLDAPSKLTDFAPAASSGPPDQFLHMLQWQLWMCASTSTAVKDTSPQRHLPLALSIIAIVLSLFDETI